MESLVQGLGLLGLGVKFSGLGFTVQEAKSFRILWFKAWGFWALAFRVFVFGVYGLNIEGHLHLFSESPRIPR